MSFWTECEKCYQSIYMAQVVPPDENYLRWLPFEDEDFTECHLDNCNGRVRGLYRKAAICMRCNARFLAFKECVGREIQCPECECCFELRAFHFL